MKQSRLLLATILFNYITKQSSESITFSDLKGLKLSKEESNSLPLSYKVQDKLYGPGIAKWVGEVIKIDGKIFPHGKGHFYYTDGKTMEKEMQSFNESFNTFYTGESQDGKPHGKGTLTYSNGDSYTGRWENGKMKGGGTFTFANGDFYVGEFKDDNLHGKGK